MLKMLSESTFDSEEAKGFSSVGDIVSYIEKHQATASPYVKAAALATICRAVSMAAVGPLRKPRAILSYPDRVPLQSAESYSLPRLM